MSMLNVKCEYFPCGSWHTVRRSFWFIPVPKPLFLFVSGLFANLYAGQPRLKATWAYLKSGSWRKKNAWRPDE